MWRPKTNGETGKNCMTCHRILDVAIDGGKWFAAKVVRKNEELMNKKDAVYEKVTVLIIPTSGWRLLPSQDIPTLFSCGHIYYYALESIKIVHLESEMKNETDCGLGHLTGKPLKNGRKYVD